MQMLHNFNCLRSNGKQNRQYRLIHYITWELLTVCAVILPIYSVARLWYLVVIISIAASITLTNLWILKRTQNTFISGHIVTLTIFLTIVSANYLIWGVGPLHSQWFYVMPVLAASLTGINGLLIYSVAAIIILIGFGEFTFPPHYELPIYQRLIIQWVNHIFAFIVTVTTLASLIYESQRYEKELNNKNYLLQTEKDKYHDLAQFDPLTGLANRRYFIQYLEDTIATLEPNFYVTVFFIDLDNFKSVNDRYGHNAGDELLLEVSKRLKLSFRETDFIARLGGDEFTAIIVHAPNEQIPQAIAHKIMQEFTPLFKFANNVEYHYSLSMGSATYPKDAQKASDLIIKADLAMYAAKKIDGNSYSGTISIKF